MTPERAKHLAISVSKKLKIEPRILIHAIMLAVDESKAKNKGICRLCGTKITFEGEFAEALAYYKKHPNEAYTYERGFGHGRIYHSPEKYARRHASYSLSNRRVCSRCKRLSFSIESGGTNLAQFFGTFAAAKAVASCTSNAGAVRRTTEG
jgi:hypothetical protein